MFTGRPNADIRRGTRVVWKTAGGVAQSGGLYKIGMSKSPVNRMSDLKKEFRRNVELVHIFYTKQVALAEHVVHIKFAGKRKEREWFALDKEDIDYLKSIKIINTNPLEYFSQSA